MDNRDGTLSLFATILDHAAPIAPPAAGTNAGGFRHDELTSIGRVLAWNDPQRQGDPPTPTSGAAAGRTATWSWC